VFGEIVFWLVILVFLTAATSVLGLQVFTGCGWSAIYRKSSPAC
jgi:hypothetical protein